MTIPKQMLPIPLCPNRDLPSFFSVPGYQLSKETEQDDLQNHIKRRDEELRALYPGNVTQTPASRFHPGDLPLSLTIPLYLSLRAPKNPLPALIPLNECILDIAWEISNLGLASSILKFLENKPLDSFVTLLRSAAMYQAKLESLRHITTLLKPADAILRID